MLCADQVQRIFARRKDVSVYKNHTSLRTAFKTPYLTQRIACYLSYFLLYTFVGFYNPGKKNILAGGISRRVHYDPRREMGHPPGSDDDEDDDICLCCTKL